MEQKSVNQFFANLRTIHKEREQYNLEWAFRNAQEEMDTYRAKILKGKLESRCVSCNHRAEAMAKFKDLVANSQSMGKRSKWIQRFFQNIFGFLTFAEVAVSFFLVFTLTQVSHMGNTMIHSEGFSILFAMTFAFFKVVLERYWVEPRMNDWGWKLYIDSVDRLDQMTTELMDFAGNEEEWVQVNQIPQGIMGGMKYALIRQKNTMET